MGGLYAISYSIDNSIILLYNIHMVPAVQEKPRKGIMSNETSQFTPEIRELKGEGLAMAAEIVANGGLAYIQYGRVFGIFFDGNRPELVKRVKKIKKHDDPDRKFAVFMFWDEILDQYLDYTKVDIRLRHLVMGQHQAGKLSKHRHPSKLTGSKCHNRIPVEWHRKAEFGEHLLSRDQDGTMMLQFVDPTGHEFMEDFVRRLRILKVLPAVTTLNLHNQGESNSVKEASEVLLDQDEPWVLFCDPLADSFREGSYAILDWRAAQWKRDGNIPIESIENILGLELERGF